MDRIHRRDFLRMTSAGALLGGWFLSGCDRTCWDTSIPEDHARRVFSIYEELASLEYFDLDCDGILRTVVDLPEIIDLHTHLGFAYLESPPVPLLESTPEVAYLFDPTIEPTTIDLDDYSNQLTTEAIVDEATTESVAALGPNGSERALTHTIPNLLREMDGLGIGQSVVLPIALAHGDDDPTATWMDAIEAAGAGDRILPFGSVHPEDPDWEDKLRAQVERGILGLKLHPTMQQVYPDDEATMAVCALAGDLGLPVLFHSGRAGIEPEFMAKFAHLDRFVDLVAGLPDVTFVFAHSGALLDFDAAVALAEAHDNVLMDLAGPGVPAIRQMLDVLGPERLLFGTDWPFFSQALDLAKVLLATADDEGARRMLLAENAIRILGL